MNTLDTLSSGNVLRYLHQMKISSNVASFSNAVISMTPSHSHSLVISSNVHQLPAQYPK